MKLMGHYYQAFHGILDETKLKYIVIKCIVFLRNVNSQQNVRC